MKQGHLQRAQAYAILRSIGEGWETCVTRSKDDSFAAAAATRQRGNNPGSSWRTFELRRGAPCHREEYLNFEVTEGIDASHLTAIVTEEEREKTIDSQLQSQASKEATLEIDWSNAEFQLVFC
ncbi:hypothetical protein MRB53_011351 [Persea americana]|uniref:Uncharacterized protein n=1 Tax=Persea americana TaxID=3435 RepID=A0ACC2LUS2_PERAE|nr:hypothetical protein MRB53_011351 [Persea americana]